MTKIESWLRKKKIAWDKDNYSENEPRVGCLNPAKEASDIVENFIEFAFSDEICFLDEDEDEPMCEPEDCENCKNIDELSNIEYERVVTYKDGTWVCDNCNQPV